MMGENTMFDVLRYIRECFGIFHVEGDEAVFEDVKAYLKAKGAYPGAIGPKGWPCKTELQFA